MNYGMKQIKPTWVFFNFWPQWLVQYYNEQTLGKANESVYLKWKSEQPKLTPKYEIFRSFVPLVKQQHLTLVNDDKNYSKLTVNVVTDM